MYSRSVASTDSGLTGKISQQGLLCLLNSSDLVGSCGPETANLHKVSFVGQFDPNVIFHLMGFLSGKLL